MSGCMRCGKCCTNFGVCVTPFDLRRLTCATGLAPQDIVMAIDEPPDRERAEPAILIDGLPSLLVLRWRGNPERRCMFYSGNGCMAYESRPMLCRTYPFRAENGKLVDFGSRACPRLWLPDSPKPYLDDFKCYSQEVESYRKIAQEWNSRRGGTLEEFVRFAMERAGKPPNDRL